MVMVVSRELAAKPRWHLIPVRVLLVTFLLTLFCFAVSLLLGILGVVVAARLRGSPSEYVDSVSLYCVADGSNGERFRLDLCQRNGNPPLPSGKGLGGD